MSIARTHVVAALVLMTAGCAIFSDTNNLEADRDMESSSDPDVSSPDASTRTDGGRDESDAGTEPDDMGGEEDLAGMPDSGGADDVGGLDGSSGESYADVIMSHEPIGYWRLGDEIAPTAVNEVVGRPDGTYRNGVTLSVAGLLADDSDTGVDLDGEDDRIELGDNYDFAGTAPFSLEAWIAPAAIDAEYMGIFSKEVNEGGNQGYGFTLNYGVPRFIRIVDGASYDLIDADDPLPVGERSHVVVTYDGFSVLIFVDGVEVASGGANKQLKDNSRTLMIGARGLFDGIDEFKGVIDEIAIYDYPLPPSRIASHYAAGTGN